MNLKKEIYLVYMWKLISFSPRFYNLEKNHGKLKEKFCCLYMVIAKLWFWWVAEFFKLKFVKSCVIFFHSLLLIKAIKDYETAQANSENDQQIREGLERAQRMLKQSQKRDYYKILGVKRWEINIWDGDVKAGY